MIDIIAGARPNFIKIASIIDSIKKVNGKIKYRLIHTGQHFDQNMSGDFFNELEIPFPDINLKAGGGSQAEQTAKIMIGYEAVLMNSASDLCLVVGDVNSTMACSIVAKKMGLRVAHVEAGIRSNDINMPEEINRIVTDSITDYFFTTSETANQNLTEMGIPPSRIFFVGNTMIDTLLKREKLFKKPAIWHQIGLKNKNFLVMTLHRPSNVDDKNGLKRIITLIVNNTKGLPIIFPAHPRIMKNLDSLVIDFKNLHIIKPMKYLEFNYLVKKSKAVITDSGGITEEATVLNVPCLTLRENTERPETIQFGTNELLGTDPNKISDAFKKLFLGKWKKGTNPPLWDGKTSYRIVEHLLNL